MTQKIAFRRRNPASISDLLADCGPVGHEVLERIGISFDKERTTEDGDDGEDTRRRAREARLAARKELADRASLFNAEEEINERDSHSVQ